MNPWWAVGGGGVLLLVAGAWLHTPELLVIGSVAVASCAYAWGFTRRGVNLDVVREVVPERVTVGEPASLIVTVTNPDSRPSPGVVGRHDTGRGVEEFSVPRLAAGTTERWALPLDTSRRGAFDLSPVELERTDPLRLLTRSRAYGDADRFLVLPRHHRIRMLRASSRKGDDGDHGEREVHGSESFHALREYVTGDDHRLIHWRSSARSGQLVVKQFADLWQPELLLVIDTRASVYTGDLFEDAIEAAASVAWANASARCGVSILTGAGRRATAHVGSTHHRSLLDLLAMATCADGADLAELARGAVAGGTRRAVVLITGAPDDDEVRSFVATVRPFQRRVVVRIADGLVSSPLVEMSSAGDEAVSASDVAGFVDGWARLTA